MRIMVVDDDPEIVGFTKRGLAYQGAQQKRRLMVSKR